MDSYGLLSTTSLVVRLPRVRSTDATVATGDLNHKELENWRDVTSDL